MKIMIVGAGGRMGSLVKELAIENGNEVVAAVDIKSGYINDIADYEGDADVVIDFSLPQATEKVLDYAVRKSLPLVMAVTGHSPSERRKVISASKKVAIFYSPTLSIGVAASINAAKNILKAFPAADLEICERHHALKADSPSGTALFMAERLGYKPVYGRKKRRSRNEAGIASLRYGNVCGTHETIIAGGDEIITIKHEAVSRKVFALGALKAARFIVHESCGIYDVFSLLNEDRIF
ncbi:MAG: 4-hydroxy-tetrahydrodipicolinate reductase [Clostridia bacterium]|nr:4-hydroxy-tetrahydrodipicolinate reductase [Clostridia bacterium]